MENTNSAKLSFHSFNVIRTKFERNPASVVYKANINISHKVDISKENPIEFVVWFLVELSSTESENPLNIEVEAFGLFSMEGMPTEQEFKNFTHISAPSIMYVSVFT